MANHLLARIRHLILGPGRHHRRTKRPEPMRISPMEFQLMFSGQMMRRRYYKEANGCRQEYIVR